MLRPREVVALVEGTTGSRPARYRRRQGRLPEAPARFVDRFVASKEQARGYLVRTLKVPDEKIVVGWWLAACLRTWRHALPGASGRPPMRVPSFVCAGRLVHGPAAPPIS